jgi:hypothetical protein
MHNNTYGIHVIILWTQLFINYMQQYMLSYCHHGCHIDVIYVVIRELCYSSTPYGLLEILTHSRKGWRCSEGFVLQYWYPAYCTLLSIISSLTESDFRWPTPLFTFVYSDHNQILLHRSQEPLDLRLNLK